MSELIYIGNGAAIIGVPARDLTAADLIRIKMFSDLAMTPEDLIKTGLYKNKNEPAPKKESISTPKRGGTFSTKEGE